MTYLQHSEADLSTNSKIFFQILKTEKFFFKISWGDLESPKFEPMRSAHLKKWFGPLRCLTNQRAAFDLDKNGEISLEFLTTVPGVCWFSVVPSEVVSGRIPGWSVPSHFLSLWFCTTLIKNSLNYCRFYRKCFIFKLKIPKQGQNRLPRPLRLLQMPQRAFQSLPSTYLLFPIPLLLTLLLPCVFHVFSMDRVHKVVNWLNLTKLSLKLNRTHSRYLFEPRLHATVARRLTITETRVLNDFAILLTYWYK